MKIAYSSIAGSYHIASDFPCQDYAYGANLKNGITVLAAADGAGSYAKAQQSAQSAVHTLCDYFKWQKTLQINEGELFAEINRQQYALGDVEVLGTTLLFVAVQGSSFIAGHMGDGAIFLEQNGRISVLSLPENGSFSNETFLFPSDFPDHFRIYRGTCCAGDGFILASDGVSALLYDDETRECMPACRHILDYLRCESKKETEEWLRRNMETLFSDYSTDDKTLAVMCV